MIISGSAPFAMADASAASPAALSPAMALVRMAMESRRPDAQHFGNAVSGQAVSGHCCRLVEKRQRSRTDPSAARAMAVIASASAAMDSFADRAQMRSKRFRRHPPQVKALASRQDGDRNLADLGGGKDELHIVGRLFSVSRAR